MLKARPKFSTERGEQNVCVRIRKEREARDWTQAELGAMVGVSEQTISRYERNRPPKIAMLGKIASALGITVHDLMPEARATDPDLAALIEWWRSAPRTDRRTLLQLARSLEDARQPDDRDDGNAARPAIRR